MSSNHQVISATCCVHYVFFCFVFFSLPRGHIWKPMKPSVEKPRGGSHASLLPSLPPDATFTCSICGSMIAPDSHLQRCHHWQPQPERKKTKNLIRPKFRSSIFVDEMPQSVCDCMRVFCIYLFILHFICQAARQTVALLSNLKFII